MIFSLQNLIFFPNRLDELPPPPGPEDKELYTPLTNNQYPYAHFSVCLLC